MECHCLTSVSHLLCTTSITVHNCMTVV